MKVHIVTASGVSNSRIATAGGWSLRFKLPSDIRRSILESVLPSVPGSLNSENLLPPVGPSMRRFEASDGRAGQGEWLGPRQGRGRCSPGCAHITDGSGFLCDRLRPGYEKRRPKGPSKGSLTRSAARTAGEKMDARNALEADQAPSPNRWMTK